MQEWRAVRQAWAQSSLCPWFAVQPSAESLCFSIFLCDATGEQALAVVGGLGVELLRRVRERRGVFPAAALLLSPGGVGRVEGGPRFPVVTRRPEATGPRAGCRGQGRGRPPEALTLARWAVWPEPPRG